MNLQGKYQNFQLLWDNAESGVDYLRIDILNDFLNRDAFIGELVFQLEHLNTCEACCMDNGEETVTIHIWVLYATA